MFVNARGGMGLEPDCPAASPSPLLRWSRPRPTGITRQSMPVVRQLLLRTSDREKRIGVDDGTRTRVPGGPPSPLLRWSRPRPTGITRQSMPVVRQLLLRTSDREKRIGVDDGTRTRVPGGLSLPATAMVSAATDRDHPTIDAGRPTTSLTYLRPRKANWGGRWDSNPRRPGSQPGALPTELRPPYASRTRILS